MFEFILKVLNNYHKLNLSIKINNLTWGEKLDWNLCKLQEFENIVFVEPV